MKGTTLAVVFAGSVFDIHNRPDTSLQESVELPMEFVRDMNPRETEVVHRSPIFHFAGKKADFDAVDESMFSVLFYKRLRLVGFVMTEVVALERFTASIPARISCSSSDAQYFPRRYSKTYEGTFSPPLIW